MSKYNLLIMEKRFTVPSPKKKIKNTQRKVIKNNSHLESFLLIIFEIPEAFIYEHNGAMHNGIVRWGMFIISRSHVIYHSRCVPLEILLTGISCTNGRERLNVLKSNWTCMLEMQPSCFHIDT